MEWTAMIGPALMLALGALLKWAGDVAKGAWDDRQKARQHREDEQDLLFLTIRELTDELGRVRAVMRRHDVPEQEIGPLIVTSWDVHRKGQQ